MKWLLIFFAIGMDTPIYLEFDNRDICEFTGRKLQEDFKENKNSQLDMHSTFSCVEQN